MPRVPFSPFAMLRTETVRIEDQYKGIREISKQLDITNAKILSAMWKYGPRNLLEVSRRTGIPFTSVYHRVAKLEAKSRRVASLMPTISKLGMMKVVVLAAANPGYEEKVTAALEIPNFWWSHTRTEGLFTHYSIHAVPVKFLKDLRKYLRRIQELKLVSRLRVIMTGGYFPNFPNFDYYKPSTRQWTFEWDKWLTTLKRNSPSKTIEDPESYPVLVDRKDLLIIKELEKNARRSFADLAPILGISLQGVKYHFDRKLSRNGIVQHYGFDIVPYPMEVSAYHEAMLEFPNAKAMNKFVSIVKELFFVLGISKVLRRNALLVRTYILESQLQNMFAFFSEMAKAGLLESYSSIRLNFADRHMQTISYELFDEKKGWTFDVQKCLSALSKLR